MLRAAERRLSWVAFPRRVVLRQRVSRVMRSRDEARCQLDVREHDQAVATGMSRRPVQDPGATYVAHDVADDPTRRLDALEKRHALPVGVRLGPDRRPVRRIVAAGEIDDVLRRHQKRHQRRRRQQG